MEKHGIDFDQAQVLWEDDWCIVLPTHPGQDGEVRWLLVGAIGEKLWSAIFAERNNIVRIISVRRSRENEREAYRGQDN